MWRPQPPARDRNTTQTRPAQDEERNESMNRLAAIISICTMAAFASAALAAGQASSTPPRTSHMTDAGLHHPATLTAKAPESFQAKFTTTKGDFVVEVTRAWAPLGADRFYNLVRAGYFTDCAFFRVLSGFMAQFGISPNPAIAKA